jgi:Flp pilus assembly pilin Flp
MRYLLDNRGIEASEVALLMAVIVVVVYGAYKLLGENINMIVKDVAGKI